MKTTIDQITLKARNMPTLESVSRNVALLVG